MPGATSIFVGDIPNCLPDLKDAVSDYDREADESIGLTPDGRFTRDDFEYMKSVHPDQLARFQSFDHFRGYVRRYIRENRFNPVCQEESGLAVDELPIVIANIPRCVVAGGVSLYSALVELDSKAGGGRADGRFSQDDFRRIKRNGSDLANFARFGQFKRYVRQFIDSQRCTDECRAERNMSEDPEGDAICYAPDEPDLPQIPPPRRKPRHRGKGSGDRPEPDLSAFDYDPPKWLSDGVPYESDPAFARPSPTRFSRIPTFDELLADHMKSPFEADIDLPGPMRTDVPNFKVSFDGEDFIFDVYGCFVKSRRDRRCIADWPYYIAMLKNHNTQVVRKRHAGPDGKVRVRVPASIGDRVSGFGIDASTQSFSMNKLYWQIMADGSIELIRNVLIDSRGNEYKAPSFRQRAAKVLQGTGVGTGISALIDPIGTWRRYLEMVDEANKNGFSGEVDPKAKDTR